MATQREVRIPFDDGTLYGDLLAPADPAALVLFVNGRGAGRHSVDDRTVAASLHPHRIGTLLVDLFTPVEQQSHLHSGKHGVDTALLTSRAMDAVAWIQSQAELQALPLGVCGVAAGSAPALIAAGRLGGQIQAMVSVGGRPDQAGPAVLASIRAPTLILAGSADSNLVALNDAAYQHLRGERSLAVIPGGGPLLEEPGVLQHAGEMAADWFTAHLLPMEEVA